MTEEEQKIADAEALSAKEQESKDEKSKEESSKREYTEEEKKQYARAKKAEEENKKLKEDMRKLLEENKEPKKEEENINKSQIDPIESALLIRKLSNYDDKEIAFARKLNQDIFKALESEEFILYLDAKRQKDKINNNNLDPDNKFVGDKKKDPFFEKFSANMPKGFQIK